MKLDNLLDDFNTRHVDDRGDDLKIKALAVIANNLHDLTEVLVALLDERITDREDREAEAERDRLNRRGLPI